MILFKNWNAGQCRGRRARQARRVAQPGTEFKLSALATWCGGVGAGVAPFVRKRKEKEEANTNNWGDENEGVGI